MAWFSPVKGAYPSLAQIDKTLPIGESTENLSKIKRGTVMYVDGDTNTFKLGAAEGNTYISLQNYDDTQAEFAGGTWFGNGKTDIVNSEADSYVEIAHTPAVTGLSMTMAGEYETDNFFSTDDDAITVGTKLTAGTDGIIKKAGSSDPVFAICTSAPVARWVNNAWVTQGYGASRRQGASVSVIRFKTI
jgi:hypothetical protein